MQEKKQKQISQNEQIDDLKQQILEFKDNIASIKYDKQETDENREIVSFTKSR